MHLWRDGGRAQMHSYLYVVIEVELWCFDERGSEGLVNVKGNTVGIGRK